MKPLDLSEVPTEKALRRAGAEDGALYPMRRGDAGELGNKLDRLLKRREIEGGLRGELPPRDPRFAALKRAKERYQRARAINLLFGRAVKAWRAGERDGNGEGGRAEAVELFGQYMEKYPRSPWSGEAALHLGYAAKNDGRLLDAADVFQEVTEKTSDKPNKKLRQAKRERKERGGEITDAEREADVDKAMQGAASLEEAVEKLDSSKESDDDDESFEIHLKAKQQLADIAMAMGHYNDASDRLVEMMKEDTDWHRRVWARTQLQRANFLANKGGPLMACGPQALGMMMVGLHKEAEAEKVKAAVTENTGGFSMAELQTLAAKNGVKLRGFRADVGQLSELALPAILHYDYGSDSKAGGKGSGHFVALQGVDAKSRMVRLFDPLSKTSSRLSYAQLKRQWSGQGLAVADASVHQVGATLDAQTMKTAVGSSTTFGSPQDIGDSGSNSSVGVGDGINAPYVAINQASLNMYVQHTVFSYQPPKGPALNITMSYNGNDARYYGRPSFGSKWFFNYSSNAKDTLRPDPEGSGSSASGVEIEMPDGSTSFYYKPQAGNRLYGVKGDFNYVEYTPGSDRCALVLPDGTRWIYEGGDYRGRYLTKVIDRWGYGLKFNYVGSIASRRIDTISTASYWFYADGSFGGQLTEGAPIVNFVYGSDGQDLHILIIRDRLGHEARFGYDSYTSGLTTSTDLDGRVFRYDYDATYGDIKRIDLPLINQLQGPWLFDREESTGTATPNYPAPGAEMGSNIRLTATDPMNSKSEYYYNGANGQSFFVTPQNYLPYPGNNNASRYTAYSFQVNVDGNRVPVTTQFPDGTSITRRYESQHGFVDKVTDRQGGETRFAYNPQGQVTSTTDPKGNISTTTYASNGIDPISVTQPNPNSSTGSVEVMSATYTDGYHQPATVTDNSSGGTTSFTYTAWGDPETVTDPQQRTTQNIYDSEGRLSEVKKRDVPTSNTWLTMAHFDYVNSYGSSATSVRDTRYDSLVKQAFDAAGLKTSYQYDDRRDISKVTYPDNTTEEIIYQNVVGLDPIPVGFIDRSNRTSTVAYDALGRATATRDAANQLTQMAYDRNGNLKQLTDSKNNVTQWNYDVLDRTTSKRYLDGITEIYSYGYWNHWPATGKGRLVQTTGTRGQIVKFEYDANGNQTKTDYPNMADVMMTYNRLDDVAQVTDGIGTHVMSYDDYGRLTSNDGPMANDTQTYTYDELERIKTQTVECGANGGVQSQTYTYDALGRLAILNASGAAAPAGATTYSYDGNTERLRILSHPNGTKTDLRYDAYGRLAYNFNGANGNTLYNRYAYGYNANDTKSWMQTRTGTDAVPIATTNYTYNALDELKQERVTGGVAGTPYTTDYNYDAMGNRTQVNRASASGSSVTTSTPNALNQMRGLTTTVSNGPTTSANLIYDAAGNLTIAENNDGTRTVYFYDDADRLVRIERRNVNNDPIQIGEFGYDYASRRVMSRDYTHNGTTWVKTDERNRVFDGLDVIQERHANNYLIAHIVRDGGVGGILSRWSADGPAYYGYDGNGNVTLLTNAAGQDVGHYRYDAFGNTLEAEGPRAAENPYRFSTKELHGPSGLYDYGYRFYSPGLGRWMNRDPLEEEGGINLYGFVGNSPINGIDEYGLHDSQMEAAQKEAEQKFEEERQRQLNNQANSMGGIAGNGRGRGGGAPINLSGVGRSFGRSVSRAASAVKGFFSGPSATPNSNRRAGGTGKTKTTKALPTFTKTTVDRSIASSRLPKGKTSRGASLLAKRVADGLMSGVKPTQANADKILRDVLNSPLRTRATQRTGQMDAVGRSFNREVGVRINTQTGQFIGFRTPDF